jgi:hypothetical protein
MLELLSPRRKAKQADQPPPSPPFFHLTALSSPTPAPRLRRPAGGAARFALLVRYFWLLLPRHLVSFCCGAVAAAVFLSATPQDGGGHTGAAGSCGQQLLRATSATRSALTACHAAAAPAARASALLALDAASRVPARVYLAAVLLFALCSTLVAAWRAVSVALAVRGTRAQKWLARRSAAAAASSPVLLLVTVFLLLPQRVRSALTAPPLLVLIALGIPSIASFAALRSGAALPSSEACLSYWCSLTPILAAHGTPLVGAMLRSAVLASPAWRAAAVVACIALQWPTTGCASAACAALAPTLAPLAGRTGARAGTLAVLLQGLWARVAPGWLSGNQTATSSSGMASLTTALGATTPALLLCTLCLLGAGPMVAVALPVAAVLCPAASSLATLGLQPGRRSASGGDAQQRAVYIRGALTYWALASAALAIGTLPSAAALWAWVPLRRRLLLAACLHLQLLGSAPRLTRAGLLVVASAVRSMAPGHQASGPPAGGVGSPEPAAVGDEWRPRTVTDNAGGDGPAASKEPRRLGGDAGADPDELRPVALEKA